MSTRDHWRGRLQCVVERSAPRSVFTLPESKPVLKSLPYRLLRKTLPPVRLNPFTLMSRRLSHDPTPTTDDRGYPAPRPVRPAPGDVCLGGAPTGGTLSQVTRPYHGGRTPGLLPLSQACQTLLAPCQSHRPVRHHVLLRAHPQ